jgi:hypothetical protein
MSVTVPPADFDGTYSIALINSSWNNPSASRTISVTVKQYEYAGGASYTTVTTPVTIVPNNVTPPLLPNGVLLCGYITLPFKAFPKDNTGGFFTVIVNDSNTSDRFYDCLILDTMGQTVIISEPTSGYINYYLDQPDPKFDLGAFLGSQQGRPYSISVTDALGMATGPMSLHPGENAFLVYCADAVVPAVAGSYWPAFFLDNTL